MCFDISEYDIASYDDDNTPPAYTSSFSLNTVTKKLELSTNKLFQ